MKIRKINPILTVAIAAMIIFFSGCTFRVGKGAFGYNMKGVNIPSDCKTASVQYFVNRAPIIQPALAQDLTERLRDKILSDTPLKLTSASATGDVNFSGIITGYSTQPIAAQAGPNPTAAQNRLTISITVSYHNAKDPQWDFDNKSFSRFIDYESNRTLTDIEHDDKYAEMLDLLIQDAFNQAFVNW